MKRYLTLWLKWLCFLIYITTRASNYKNAYRLALDITSDVFDEIMMSPDMRIDMMMEPGDMQFANNYMVLHSRTAFDDHDEKDLWRKKLRLWLKMENARLLAPEFPGRNGFGVPAYL